jgi:hypothetical protein
VLIFLAAIDADLDGAVDDSAGSVNLHGGCS